MKMILEALETAKEVLLQYVDSIVELKVFIEKKRRAKYLLRGLNRLCVIVIFVIKRTLKY